ncbi:Aluminum-activated malate transporter 12 [Linum perenne]
MEEEVAGNYYYWYWWWKKKGAMAWEKAKRAPGLACRRMWKLGREDPRRAIHAVKVGLALTLVSLLYLLEPLFQGIGQNAIWAVMTVVVVLEFTAGATLCKGLNRGVGTILAGSLAFFIEFIAEKTGHIYRAIFIAIAVFIIGAVATYLRFFPYVKKNYDYGVVIFLLTFNLITVSSFRISNVLKIAHQRFITIAIGCGICLFITLLVFPIWSSQDLHNSTVNKLLGLANSIQACVNDYFSDESAAGKEVTDDDESKSSSDHEEDPIYKGYKAVLDSKSADETLALYASWEPRHSRNCRYPWQQYVQVGAALRRFSYTVVALHGCLQTEIQTPKSCRALFKDPCVRLASEVAKVLKELASSIENRRHCSPEILSDHLQKALQDLNNAIKSQPRLFLGSNSNQATNNILAMAAAQARQETSLSSVKTDTSALLGWKKDHDHHHHHNHHQLIKESGERKVLLRPQLSKIAMIEFCEALPFAAFASLLVETVAKLDNVMEEVEELARVACFKEYIKPVDDDVVLTVPKVIIAHTNNLPSHGCSLLYLLEPLFQGIGQNAIWAVMTVVVVLEFTAGATLCKGLNRGVGTILAGSLAFFIEFIAEKTGHIYRAIFIAIAVFIIGAVATYLRFFPYVKKNYDYGVVIFLLTFNLITVSSFRISNVLKIAHQRFITIAIGCGICLFITLLVFPIWSSQDLHNSTVNKLLGLANSIQACVNDYFSDESAAGKEVTDDDESKSSSDHEEDPIYKGYKAVLDSKSADETLALYASWEPRHSRNCRYPWQQYVQVGAALRRFSYTVVALHGCLQTEIQTPKSCRALFKDPCVRLASEVAKVLKELASSIENRRHCSPEILSDHLQKALQDLNNAIKSQPRLFLGSNSNQATNNILAMAAAQARQETSLSSVKTDTSALLGWKKDHDHHHHHNHHQLIKESGERKVLLRPQLSKIAMIEFCEALPFAAFASLLVETVAKLDNVMEEVEELARVACFKEYIKPVDDDVVLTVPKVIIAHTNNLPSHGCD